MRDISKADWKLFRERIGEWQEAYMAKLNREYVTLLTGDGHASEKFWALKERIRKDKNTPGVRLELKKSEVDWNLITLMRDGVITAEGLDGFSEELKEYVIRRAEYRYDDED